MERLNILYRGPLSSCNYDCHYCPFAKRRETVAELARDRQSLHRFIAWLRVRTHRHHGVFFTPWGEALTRRWYRDAITQLSHNEHIARVAVQTNLSCRLDWLRSARVEKVALWCTYHPGEVPRRQFLEQCAHLESLGVRFSVGVVGLPEHADEIRHLRADLPEHVYLWINAYKSSADRTDSHTENLFAQIDPLFPINNTYHESQGKACDTGLTTVSIDGEGDVRRCHFVTEKLGNIFEQDLETLLRPRLCPQKVCGCHIGYVHLPHLGLKEIFAENILERIPLDRANNLATDKNSLLEPEHANDAPSHR